MDSYKYAKTNVDFKKLNINGVLIGGSVVYKHQELESLDESKDWDGIILVKNKSDMVNLVNVYRNELCDLLDIAYEEFPELMVPSEEQGASEALCNSFDAVRFVGRTLNQMKKGAKILSVDHLSQILKENHPSLINLLSYKDIRVKEHEPNAGIVQYDIQQATRLDDNLAVLHTVDICVTTSCSKHGTCEGTFDAIADLLITGTWIYDDGSHTGDLIAMEFFRKFHRIHTASLDLPRLMSTFKNYPKFQPLFRQNLEKRFSQYYSDSMDLLKQQKCVENLMNEHHCYWGELPYVLLEGVQQEMRVNSFESLECTYSKNLPLQEIRNPQLSFNFRSGYCGKKPGIFGKQTMFLKDELAGANLVQQYYRFTQIPLMVNMKKHVIYYPLFDGVPLGVMRFQFLKRNFHSETLLHSDLEPKILTIELQRSEDLLRAYCASAKMSTTVIVEPASLPNIHRFFYHRLNNDAGLKEFYKGVHLPGGLYWRIEEFKRMNFIVNGKAYGKLSDIIDNAIEHLDPSNFCHQLTVCGMGNGHCGNLLVGKQKQKNTTYKYLHVDYEAAGIHSPLLDLARPFYVDVFFDLFFADEFTPNFELYDNKIVCLELSPDELSTLKINITIPKSSISKAVYEIKKRYILLPFLKFVENDAKLQLSSDWPSIFGQALFCCALLMKNFCNRPDVFFANLALGIMLSSIRSIEDLDNIVNGSLD